MSNGKKKNQYELDPTGFSDAQFEELNRQTRERQKKEAQRKHEAKNPYQASDGERFRTKRQAQAYDAKLQKKREVTYAKTRYNTRTATLEDINLLEATKVLTNIQASRYRIDKNQNVEGSMEANLDSSTVIPGHVPHFEIKKIKEKADKKKAEDEKKVSQAKLKKASDEKDKAVATRIATKKLYNMRKAKYDIDYKAMEEEATWVEASEEYDPMSQEIIKTPAGWKPKKDLTPAKKKDFDLRVAQLETLKKKLGTYISDEESPLPKQPIIPFSF